jgi:hypothetical protein
VNWGPKQFTIYGYLFINIGLLVFTIISVYKYVKIRNKSSSKYTFKEVFFNKNLKGNLETKDFKVITEMKSIGLIWLKVVVVTYILILLVLCMLKVSLDYTT